LTPSSVSVWKHAQLTYQLWGDFKRFRWHKITSSRDPDMTSRFLPEKVQKWLTSYFRGYFPRFGSTGMAEWCSDCVYGVCNSPTWLKFVYPKSCENCFSVFFLIDLYLLGDLLTFCNLSVTMVTGVFTYILLGVFQQCIGSICSKIGWEECFLTSLPEDKTPEAKEKLCYIACRKYHSKVGVVSPCICLSYVPQ
jgi:hypothetical protein